jgi:predicted nucleic acid-binding protein
VIFADTSFFVALLLPKDKHHARAVKAIEEFDQSRLPDVLLTTNNVVLETITVTLYEGNHRSAVRCRRAALWRHHDSPVPHHARG